MRACVRACVRAYARARARAGVSAAVVRGPPERGGARQPHARLLRARQDRQGPPTFMMAFVSSADKPEYTARQDRQGPPAGAWGRDRAGRRCRWSRSAAWKLFWARRTYSLLGPCIGRLMHFWCSSTALVRHFYSTLHYF